MRAFIINGPFDSMIGSWEKPVPGPREVLVEVGAAGICAGDLYAYTGKNPYVIYPMICGHEIAGQAVEVGNRVEELIPGTQVVVEPFIGCGECYPCRIGKSNCCANLRIIGAHLPGGYAEYLTAPVELIHPVPPGLSLSEASFAEPVAIGVQACRRGGVGSENVLVLGTGPIGLSVIEVARARGARVLATDIVPERLRTAAEFGADTVLADANLLETVLDRTDGEGFPVVIEATGSPRVMEQTVDLVAAGGRIVILGLVKQGTTVSLPALDFTRKEMTILGSRASVDCFPEALELMAAGAITYPRVATEFNLWDAPQVFKAMTENPGMVQKGILVRDDL
ncbi:MAG: zinc-binding alcohol dehydrogenase family protein [Chloroflexota bacterium]|nr:zinc-binding alcohol dehydrogenase family protein [Chloroflexota bacterium]